MLQAVGLTIGVFAMMLALYATGTIKVTDRLRKGIFAATGAVVLVYLASTIARLFGSDIPIIHDASASSASASASSGRRASPRSNLSLELPLSSTRGGDAGAASHGVVRRLRPMVTLVWLYLEPSAPPVQAPQPLTDPRRRPRRRSARTTCSQRAQWPVRPARRPCP